MRQRYIPLAGIPASVPLHVSENGYPTGPGRTDATQVTAMKAAIAAIESQRAKYNVTDYRWFDLRDADSTGDSFESRYGLLNDDYSPKAAFTVYRDLVASLSETRARRISTPRVAQVIRRLGDRWLKPGSPPASRLTKISLRRGI
jgi:hypothetical protein